MFVGQYENSIDSKSRLIVPARFRNELGGQCVVAKGIDRCLTINTMDAWQEFLKKLDELPQSNPEARKFKRHFTSGADVCDIDKQGRITLPQKLRAYAGITKELVTIGNSTNIEVWSKEFWDEEIDSDTGEILDASELGRSMEKYGF